MISIAQTIFCFKILTTIYKSWVLRKTFFFKTAFYLTYFLLFTYWAIKRNCFALTFKYMLNLNHYNYKLKFMKCIHFTVKFKYAFKMIIQGARRKRNSWDRLDLKIVFYRLLLIHSNDWKVTCNRFFIHHAPPVVYIWISELGQPFRS